MVVLYPATAVFFAATYAIATTGTFLAATAFRRALPAWDGSIEGLAGMGRRTRMLAASVTVLLMSLAGIPPLLGFWGKFQVFTGAITASGRMFLVTGNQLLGWVYALLAAAGIVGSVVSLAYYGSVLQALYLRDPEPESAAARDSEWDEPRVDPLRWRRARRGRCGDRGGAARAGAALPRSVRDRASLRLPVGRCVGSVEVAGAPCIAESTVIRSAASCMRMQPLPLSLKVPALGLPLFRGLFCPTVTPVTAQIAAARIPASSRLRALPIAIT